MSTTQPPDIPATAAPDSGSLAVRNFLTLGAGEIVSRLIGFIGTIWIARSLGVDANGIVGFAVAVLLYFGAIGDLGMEHLGPREVAGRSTPLDTLASSMLLTRFAASASIAVVMALLGLIFVQRPDGLVLALYALTLLPMGATARWVHIGLENPKAVAISRLLLESVRVTLLLLLVRSPADLYRAPLAQLAGEMVAAAYLLVMLRARGVRIRPRIDTSLVRTLLRRGSPLLVTNLLALVIYNADVVLLRVMRDETEVGLYLAAYTLINFLGVLGNTATLSILPSLSRLRSTVDRGLALYQTSLAQAAVIGLPVAVGGAMLAPSIIQLVFGAEYAGAAVALRILILSIPLLLVRSVLLAVLIASGRQDRVLHTTAWAAVLTLIGDFSLIPVAGMVGAAAVTVAAEATRMIAAQLYATREGYDITPVRRLSRGVMAAAVMALALVPMRGQPVWLAIPAGAAVWVVALFLLGGLRRENGSVRLSV